HLSCGLGWRRCRPATCKQRTHPDQLFHPNLPLLRAVARRQSSRKRGDVRLDELAPRFDGKECRSRVEAQRPVAPTYWRQKQLIHQFPDRRIEPGFPEKQPNAMEEHAGDGLVVALGVAVHAADALVVAADDARKLLVEVDL